MLKETIHSLNDEKHSLHHEYIIIYKSINILKEKTRRKSELFNEFINKMNFKIDLSDRYLKQNCENEKEDFKLMEVI